MQLEGETSSKGESEHARKSKSKTRIVFMSKSKLLGEDQKDKNITLKKDFDFANVDDHDGETEKMVMALKNDDEEKKIEKMVVGDRKLKA
ncbi:hypothetical protein AKJ16_DCAP02219 [Drosera capensis]